MVSLDKVKVFYDFWREWFNYSANIELLVNYHLKSLKLQSYLDRKEDYEIEASGFDRDASTGRYYKKLGLHN